MCLTWAVPPAARVLIVCATTALVALTGAGCNSPAAQVRSTLSGAPSTSSTTPSGTPTAESSSASSASSTSSSGESSGSGSSSASRPTAVEVYVAAQAAARKAKTVRMAGTSTSAGVTTKLDIMGRLDGSNARGTSTTRGETYELRRVAGRTYLRQDAASLRRRLGAARARQLSGKWLVIDAAAARALAPALTPQTTLNEVFGLRLATKDQESLELVDTTEAGRPAYRLQMDDLPDSYFTISADGSYRLLRVKMSGVNPISVTFSAWDKVATTQAPPRKMIAR